MSSLVQLGSVDRYVNPPLAKRQTTIYPYEKEKSMHQSHPMSSRSLIEGPEPNNVFSEEDDEAAIQKYPKRADHARHSIMISCDKCKRLTMTEVEHECGAASFIWGAILCPVFCMGLCCFCWPGCKDVKHVCGQCQEEVGVCHSDIC